MTMSEFKRWTAVTGSSLQGWVSDACTRANGSRLLYIGGQSGRYISIQSDGTLSAGTYTGAIPHIGEAMFKQEFDKKFDTMEAAEFRVKEAGVAALIC